MNNSQISTEFLNLYRRLTYIKGLLHILYPMQDEASQEIFDNLIFSIQGDLESIDSIREALKEEQ